MKHPQTADRIPNSATMQSLEDDEPNLPPTGPDKLSAVKYHENDIAFRSSNKHSVDLSASMNHSGKHGELMTFP